MLLDRSHRSWALFSLISLTAATIGWTVTLEYSTAGPSGGSFPGLLFGIIGTVMMLFAGMLAGRRPLRHLPLGSARFWMKGHIWLGTLCIPFILFHSGFAWGGLLEQLLWYCLAFVAISGFFGLAVQQFLPGLLWKSVPLETFEPQAPWLCDRLTLINDSRLTAVCEQQLTAPAPHLLEPAKRSVSAYQKLLDGPGARNEKNARKLILLQEVSPPAVRDFFWAMAKHSKMESKAIGFEGDFPELLGRMYSCLRVSSAADSSTDANVAVSPGPAAEIHTPPAPKAESRPAPKLSPVEIMRQKAAEKAAAASASMSGAASADPPAPSAPSPAPAVAAKLSPLELMRQKAAEKAAAASASVPDSASADPPAPSAPSPAPAVAAKLSPLELMRQKAAEKAAAASASVPDSASADSPAPSASSPAPAVAAKLSPLELMRQKAAEKAAAASASVPDSASADSPAPSASSPAPAVAAKLSPLELMRRKAAEKAAAASALVPDAASADPPAPSASSPAPATKLSPLELMRQKAAEKAAAASASVPDAASADPPAPSASSPAPVAAAMLSPLEIMHPKGVAAASIAESAGPVRLPSTTPAAAVGKPVVAKATGVQPPPSSPSVKKAASADEKRVLWEFYVDQVRPYLMERGSGGVVRSSRFSSDMETHRVFQEQEYLLPRTLHPVLQELRGAVEVRRQLERQRTLLRWMHWWLMLHVPVSVLLLVFLAAHVVMALRVVPWQF